MNGCDGCLHRMFTVSYHFLDSCVSSVQVKDAGHMVPMDQPRNALEMIRRWTRGISLGSQISKTIPELKRLQPSSVFSSSWLMLLQLLLVYYSAPQSQAPLSNAGPVENLTQKPNPIPYYICACYPIMLDAKWTSMSVCRQCCSSSSMSQSTTNTKEKI